MKLKNSKENAIARDSAIAATSDAEMVAARGHQFDSGVRFPIVIDGYVESREEGDEKYSIESIPLQYSTRKFIAMMEGLGLGDDLERARNGRNIRAGKGTMRGRKYRTPKSILLVVAQTDCLAKAARNVPGVDVVAVRKPQHVARLMQCDSKDLVCRMEIDLTVEQQIGSPSARRS